MRKARNYWEETCAVLAIVVGLGLTGLGGADTFQWPGSTGPTPTSYKCNASTSLWDCTGNFGNTSCVTKGTFGNPGSNTTLYECGDTVWNSVKATHIRQYGLCNTGTGSCTEWDKYWCVAWEVYKDNYCSSDQYACGYYGSGSAFCDPNNPGGT